MTTPLIPTTSGLSLPAAVKSVFRKYATFSGRATRSEYWWWALVQYLVQAVFGTIAFIGFFISAVSASRNGSWQMMDEDNYGMSMTTSGGTDFVGLAFLIVGMSLLVIWSLGVIVPSIAVTVRRLHDAGYSGWMVLLALIPWVGGIIVLIFTLLVSQPSDNKWGAAPIRAS